MDYRNQLVMDNYKPITKKNLYRVLKLSERTTRRFIQECIKANMIIETDNGGLNLSLEFYRGKSQDNERIKIFRNVVRSIYEKMPTSEHRYFGYIVKLIPYINVKYNVLCYYIYEKVLSNVHPLTFSDVCKIMGYNTSDPSNIRKLRHILENISFKIGEDEESLCIFITSMMNNQRITHIYINPNIMHIGMHLEDIEILTALFKHRK